MAYTTHASSHKYIWIFVIEWSLFIVKGSLSYVANLLWNQLWNEYAANCLELTIHTDFRLQTYFMRQNLTTRFL